MWFYLGRVFYVFLFHLDNGQHPEQFEPLLGPMKTNSTTGQLTVVELGDFFYVIHSEQTTVTSVIGSHVDADHINGIREVVYALDIPTVIMTLPPNSSNIPRNKRWLYNFLTGEQGSIDIDQLPDEPSFIRTATPYWYQYLLIPSRKVTAEGWTGRGQNDSSLCWVMRDRFKKTEINRFGETEIEEHIWIGIAGDRDYADFSSHCECIPHWPRKFDVLSLPHHGSIHSTPASTELAPADYYVVPGYPTGRANDKVAHLNVINLVIKMLSKLRDDEKIQRELEPTILFTDTQLSENDLSSIVREYNDSRLIRVVAMEKSHTSVGFYLVPIPGSRKITLNVKDPKFDKLITAKGLVDVKIKDNVKKPLRIVESKPK